jgi:hypothetical protein
MPVVGSRPRPLMCVCAETRVPLAVDWTSSIYTQVYSNNSGRKMLGYGGRRGRRVRKNDNVQERNDARLNKCCHNKINIYIYDAEAIYHSA